MLQYELLVVQEPNQSDEQVNTTLEAIERLITESGGTVDNREVWGKRRLAYVIRKRREGHYTLVTFTCDPATSALPEMNRYLRIHEPILRFLITRAVTGKSRGELPKAIREGERRFSFGGRSYADTPQGQAMVSPVQSPSATLPVGPPPRAPRPGGPRGGYGGGYGGDRPERSYGGGGQSNDEAPRRRDEAPQEQEAKQQQAAE